eukprot:642813-Amphidinium_carterae.1
MGTIVRPTRLFGNASTAKRSRPSKTNRGENNTTEHARRWELYAMYKSIWMAAGLKYAPKYEETGVPIEDCDRGWVERLSAEEGRVHQEPGNSDRRMSRALIMETTKVYMDQKHDKPTDINAMDKQMRRRWKYTHLAHQYHATYRSEVTDAYRTLPSPDNDLDLFGSFHNGGITDYPCLYRLPNPCPRSAFIALSYACEKDQALEYQALVVRELARKAAMFDTHMVAIPEPVCLEDVVQPDNCQVYAKDETWPLGDLTVSCVTQNQYEVLENTVPEEEMRDEHDPDIDARMVDDEPIFEDENNRLEPVAMEVDDESHRASTFAGVDEGSNRVSTFTGEGQTIGHPEHDNSRTHGGNRPGVSSDQKLDEFVDCIPEIATIDSSCIRDFGEETLSVIVKKELVLNQLRSELRAFEEGSEAFQAMQGQIEVLHQMI